MIRPAPPHAGSRERTAAILFGFFLAIVVVKFGNPVIFSDQISAPEAVLELVLNSWPVSWSYGALGLAGIAAVLTWQWRAPGPKWLLAMPLVWFVWQVASATQTVDGELTRLTVLHFAGCVVCFYAGGFGLGKVRDMRPVWCGLAVGVAFVIVSALDQHFGGLERTRATVQQRAAELPAELRARLDTPEFQQKMASERVFGTFVYPNALAGALLLLLPAAVSGMWHVGAHRWFRWGVGGALALGGLAALYWSGSKAGWLIALVSGGFAVARVNLRPILKLLLLAALLGAGGLAFFGRHSGYFEKGATSLSARRDYWRAAGQMIAARPLLGYGPGTFQRQYRVLKAPEAEMAKLAHNDFLQQGCDSGVPGMLAYGVFVAGSILWLGFHRVGRGVLTAPRAPKASVGAVSTPRATPELAVWLGVLGFAVQSMVEFGLYIPALAWPFFLLLGWLWGMAPGPEHG